VNYRVSNFWVEQLMQERPELSAPLSGGRCCYGYLPQASAVRGCGKAGDIVVS
jgi:hypothetical protein